MATDKQLEANRINAQKSTGPKTDAGKEASRANAIKHGLTADTLIVLSDEDPAQLDDRVDAFFQSFNPRDEFEDHDVRRLAMLSWKADRADRHEVALTDRRVKDRIEADLTALREHVRSLSPRLLPSSDRVKESSYDAVPAAELVAMVERTAEGCRFLLAQWDMLRRSIERRDVWSPVAEMTILRLSGFEMDWIRDPRALDLLVAGRVLSDPTAEPDPDAWVAGPYNMTIDRKAMRDACGRRPTTAEGACEVLRQAIDAAAGRLDELLTVRERDGDALDFAESASLALFDAGKEGERLRRYQTTMLREMDRIVRSIGRRREKSTKEKMDEAKLEILLVKGERMGIDWVALADLRNEPNPEAEGIVDPDAADDEEVEESGILRNEPNSGEVRQECRTHETETARAVLRNEPKFDLDECDGVEWVDIPSLL